MVHLLINDDTKRCVAAAGNGVDISKYIEPFKAGYTVIHVSTKTPDENAIQYVDDVAAVFESIAKYMKEEAEKEATPLVDLFTM